MIDQKLSFTENIDFMYKKAQQRLFIFPGNLNVLILVSVSRNLYTEVWLKASSLWILSHGMATWLSRTEQS